jgi:hypothetical protein
MAIAQNVAVVRSVEKAVLISKAGVNSPFTQARLKQGLSEDQHLRTMKRSRAMLGFTDGAQLRVNERTELVIKTSQQLKRLELGAGAVWLKVPSGQRLVVETPTVTAAVRGTEFEVTAEGEVRVYEGAVDVSLKPAGNAVAVGAGQMMRANQTTPNSIPGAQLPLSYGGGQSRWWEGMIPDRENLTSSDGSAYEEVQASNLLFRYRNEERGRPALSNTETVYRGRFDVDTDSSPWPLALGGVGFLATNPSNTKGIAVHGGFSPFFGMPSYIVGDARYGFATKDAQVEGLVETRAYFHRKEKWETHLLSELAFRFRISDELTFFTGRSYLSTSAAPIDTLGQNMVSDRYTGVGFTFDDGPASYTAAWLHDVDPWIGNSQSAVTLSASRYILGGKVTANYLHREDEGGRAGLGFVFPVLPTKLELYGELSVSRGATGSNATIGAYLPDLFELADVDMFIEYQSRKRVGAAWTVYASHKISSTWSIMSHLEWVDSHHTCGVGMSIRF